MYKEDIYKMASNKSDVKMDPYKATKTVAATNAFDNVLDTVIDAGTMAGGVLIGAKIGKKKGFSNKFSSAKKALSSRKGRESFKMFRNQQMLAIPIGTGISGAYTGLAYMKDKQDAKKLRDKSIAKKASFVQNDAGYDISNLMSPNIMSLMATKGLLATMLIKNIAERREHDEMGKDVFDNVLEKQDYGRY